MKPATASQGGINMMECRSCKTQDLFGHGYYCEGCYSKTYHLVEALKKENERLIRHTDVMTKELHKAQAELADLLQPGFNLDAPTEGSKI